MRQSSRGVAGNTAVELGSRGSDAEELRAIRWDEDRPVRAGYFTEVLPAALQVGGHLHLVGRHAANPIQQQMIRLDRGRGPNRWGSRNRDAPNVSLRQCCPI